ncbi:MAG: beta-eliminating lyase-related protein, partial [Anaerolineales bacterium]
MLTVKVLGSGCANCKKLEALAARMLGKEAALFVPSGTMGNSICIKLQTHDGDEILVEELSHIYTHEMSHLAVVSRVLPRPVRSSRGVFDLRPQPKINRVFEPFARHFHGLQTIPLLHSPRPGGHWPPPREQQDPQPKRKGAIVEMIKDGDLLRATAFHFGQPLFDLHLRRRTLDSRTRKREGNHEQVCLPVSNAHDVARDFPRYGRSGADVESLFRSVSAASLQAVQNDPVFPAHGHDGPKVPERRGKALVSVVAADHHLAFRNGTEKMRPGAVRGPNLIAPGQDRLTLAIQEDGVVSSR